MCLLATWRSENVPAGHRLRGLVAELRRTGAATLLPLSRLDAASVEELVQTARTSGVDVPGAVEEALYRETEGLPFFVVEYLSAMPRVSEQGHRGEWEVPTGVRDLLQSRLASASETGRQLLSAAAAVGRSCSFDVLRDASGRSDEETVTALEDLMARGLVGEVPRTDGDGEPAYDFAHERLRDLVYELTSLARRRLLHRRIAEALSSRAAGRPELGAEASQIAHHYQLAGQEAEAAEHFKLAGEHARSLYANAEALAHFRVSLGLGHPDAPWLHQAIGDLLTLSGEYAEAISSYETAAALSELGALASVEHRLGNVHHRRGEWDLAASHFQSALAALADNGPSGLQARLHADWSLTLHHQGQTAAALELAGKALELAESAADTSALAQAHNIVGILAKSQGDFERGREHLERSLALGEELDHLAGARVASLNNLALVLLEVGQTERALELAESALKLCASQGDRHREAALHNNLSDMLYRAGRAEEAMAHLKQAVAIFAEIGEEAGTMQPEIWKLVEW